MQELISVITHHITRLGIQNIFMRKPRDMQELTSANTMSLMKQVLEPLTP